MELKHLLISLDLINHAPLALGYLKGNAVEDPVIRDKVRFIIKSFSVRVGKDTVVKYIEDEEPDIVGFSCYLWNIGYVLDISKDIKKILPNVKLVLGGPEVTPRAKEVIFENPSIDIIVRGEGEETFKDIISHYLTNSPALKDILGITYGDNGAVISNKKRPQIGDINKIPSPYLSRVIPVDENTYPYLETHRGCTFKCRYCYYHKEFSDIRYFSLARLKEELEFLMKAGVKVISFVDPTFNINAERLKDICRLIANVNNGHTSFHAELMAELVDEEMADLLSKANFYYVEVGLQSTNRKALEKVNRRCDPARFERGVRLLSERIETVELQLIMGLPGDNLSNFIESLKYALSLNSMRFYIFTLALLPGTYFLEHRDEFKIIYDRRPPYHVLSNETFSYEEMQKAKMVANSLQMFTAFFKNTIKILLKKFDNDLISLYEKWKAWINDEEKLRDASYIYTKGVDVDFPGFVKTICARNNIDFEPLEALLNKEKDLIKNNLRKVMLIRTN